MMQLEGLLNVGEAVPYLLCMDGSAGVREGDLCVLDNLTWEVIQTTAARDQGAKVVLYAVITRLAVNFLLPPAPAPLPPPPAPVAFFTMSGAAGASEVDTV